VASATALAGIVALADNGHPAWARGLLNHGCPTCPNGCGAPDGVLFEGPPDGGRNPEEEKRESTSLFSLHCIRCHGTDGKGVWDIPNIPDFTNARWQELRSDAERARIILEGRGAVMPAFRGTLTLQQAWALGRYLRTFASGTGAPRPNLTNPAKPGATSPAPARPAAGPGALPELPPVTTAAAAR
jgi:mono/diheme cytochrome c family protein